ncbi:hypothetical protein QFC22_002026 [Naganishia vaughanmartiniae]|uniref:Uncharacterized protein n=1 Tax=Naganishia vaughanmartiniae TaxID=1424756 RepID=A0ACC2XIQ8_9TREE|nr:hypothetical protein QFC22_002026 [Naganishia vaughanmartiniae]
MTRKFSAADAAKQHWGAKNQKSSTKGSEVDTSAPAPFAATSLPPPASELPPLPPIYETKRHNNEAKASKDPSETAGLQLNNVSGGHEPDKTEIPPSRHELPAKVHDQGNPVFVDSGPNSTPMPVPVQDTHLGRQKAPYYDDVYLGEVDAHPGLPPGYSKNLDKQHDKMTLQEANWNVANTHTTDNTNITLNNLAPGSSSGDQQAVGSKPPSGSGWDREPEREQYPEEKKKLRGNEITPSNIPEGDISGRTAGDGNHPTESSVPPIMVAQVQLPDDHSQLNLPYGSGDKKEIGMDIVDAKRLREEPSTTPPPRAAMNLQDVKPESRNSESPQKLNPNTTSESGFQSEIPDSLKQSLKTFCHNAKACKTRTMTFALICVGYIAATYFTSSLLIAQAPAAVAASTTASVAKRQAAINATEIAADTLSSVNDAFQDPGFLVGIVQGHVLLISTLWHLVAQLLIVCLINSIYSYEPPEGTPNEDTEKSGPSETSPLGKGSLWNPTSWWRRLTDRASRTQNWSQRHMGRWSFARYGLILALFLITLLIARQLTSLSYISRNPSSNEPWSTFPDVALIYDKLRASRTGLASGAGLVRVSMGFWFLVVFSGSYCMSTLADKPPARPSDLEQGKGVV